jgi:hypothetical protein
MCAKVMHHTHASWEEFDSDLARNPFDAGRSIGRGRREVILFLAPLNIFLISLCINNSPDSDKQ